MVSLALILTLGLLQERGGSAPECDGGIAARIWCDKCRRSLKKDEIDPAKKCKSCGEAARQANVCTKYVCGCDKGGCCTDVKSSAGKCKCGKELKANEVLTAFRCGKCGSPGEKAGRCGLKSCGGRYVEKCSMAGSDPHRRK